MSFWPLVVLTFLADLVLAALYCDACRRNAFMEAKLEWVKAHDELERYLTAHGADESEEYDRLCYRFCEALRDLKAHDRVHWCSRIARALGR